MNNYDGGRGIVNDNDANGRAALNQDSGYNTKTILSADKAAIIISMATLLLLPLSSPLFSSISATTASTATTTTIIPPSCPGGYIFVPSAGGCVVGEEQQERQLPPVQPLGPTDVTVSLQEFTPINLNDIERFRNDEIKQRILGEYQESAYNIATLQYDIMGHTITASDVQVNVDPARIDDTETRLNITVSAENGEVTGPILNKIYNNFELNSIFGIYDSTSDKLTIQLSDRTALSLLLQ